MFRKPRPLGTTKTTTRTNQLTTLNTATKQLQTPSLTMKRTNTTKSVQMKLQIQKGTKNTDTKRTPINNLRARTMTQNIRAERTSQNLTTRTMTQNTITKNFNLTGKHQTNHLPCSDPSSSSTCGKVKFFINPRSPRFATIGSTPIGKKLRFK